MGETERDNRRRVVLITGAGKPGQVGETVARTFAGAGWHVLLSARSAAEAESRAEEIRAEGGSCTPYAADLTDPAATRELARTVASREAPALDAVVHLAGGWIPGAPIAEATPDYWERSLANNLLTAAYTAHAFIPLVRAARGAFVFFASEAALPGARVAGMAAYAAAKSGVVVLARALAQEERPHGVRANVLAPGTIHTASNVAAMGEGIPYVEREDVAAAVFWLCSSDARAVNGEIIRLVASSPPGAAAGSGDG